MKEPQRICPGCRRNKAPKGELCKQCIAKGKTIGRRNEKGRRKTSDRGYGADWQKVRREVLDDAYGVCQCEHCKLTKRIRLADVVHHIVPVDVDWSLRLVKSNLMAVNFYCHERIHGRLGKGGPVAYQHNNSKPGWISNPGIPILIISGPPAAGKTTYANKIATDGDIVIDLDEIANRVLDNQGSYHDWDRGKIGEVLQVRNQILSDLSGYGAAYIILTVPKVKDRRWWIDKMGALSIVLETPIEMCIKRLQERGGVTRTAEGIAAGWWKDYERMEHETIIRYKEKI